MNGDEIRRAREAHGWTQQQLAQALGVGQRTVGNWERGATVPKNRAGMLEDILGNGTAAAQDDPIRNAPSIALLSELLRRETLRLGEHS